MIDCVFCKIVSGQIQSEILYQDEKVFAVSDINAQAPTHLLIMPIVHIQSIADLPDSETPLIAHMIFIANQLAKAEGLVENGYRLSINSGVEGGQTVQHLHLHLLGGRQLSGKLG